MPIHVYWDNEEKTILHAVFDGEWTWDDYQVAVADGVNLIEGIDYPVHQLLDMRNTTIVPAPNDLLKSMIERATRYSNNDIEVGITVIVGAPKIIEIFAKSLNKVFSTVSNRIIVTTLEEAYAQIEAYEAEQHEKDLNISDEI